MAAAVPHRGSRIRSIQLASCALAATDSPDSATDTVLGIVDNLAVAFTGTLDNAEALAHDLASFSPASRPDPADLLGILALGYRAYGDLLPSHMRGVFAAAVSDGATALAFRDHVGYRPLFYRAVGNAMLAASEAKQVVAGAGIPREPDLEVVHSIFFRTVDDETPAALRGVRRLPKATSLKFEVGGQATTRRYWNPEPLLESAAMPMAELQDRFEALFDQAVTRCLSGADAVSLSGGIDSPAVAAYAAPRHLERFGTPLHAMSVTYPKYPSVDERRYVELLAERFNIPLHLYEQEANPIADLKRWVSLADTPYPGAALAQYEEDYGRAKAIGVRTVLTGEHAEFVFAMQWYTLDHFLTHGRYRAAWKQMKERRRRGDSPVSILRLAARSVSSDRLLALRNSVGGRTAPVALPTWVDASRTAAESFLPASARWRDSQLTGFVGPGISLEAEEICQAVSGVISRKPWTDIDLWELFLSLPAEQKFPDLRPKGLVRSLLRGRVPDEILDRTDKTVFDEAALAQVDYAELDRLLDSTDHRLDGVDYAALSALIESRSLRPIDYMWARNLATAHAFLSLW